MAFTEKAKKNGHPNDCGCSLCKSLGEMYVDGLNLDDMDFPEFDDDSSDADMYAENDRDAIAAKRAEIEAEGEKIKSQMKHPENFNAEITYPNSSDDEEDEEDESIDNIIDESSEEEVAEDNSEE